MQAPVAVWVLLAQTAIYCFTDLCFKMHELVYYAEFVMRLCSYSFIVCYNMRSVNVLTTTTTTFRPWRRRADTVCCFVCKSLRGGLWHVGSVDVDCDFIGKCPSERTNERAGVSRT